MKQHNISSKEERIQKRLGKIHVYTGSGKGKTTAALGIALRGAGHHLKTTVIQFLKNGKESGEYQLQGILPFLKVYPFGADEPLDLKHPSSTDRYLAAQALDYARKIHALDRPDILVLDEILPAIHYNLVQLQDVVDFLDNKHQEMELILTGENAHPEILNRADLVTVMDSVKHYFSEDFIARRGIEN